jgi:hypothetical protein
MGRRGVEFGGGEALVSLCSASLRFRREIFKKLQKSSKTAISAENGGKLRFGGKSPKIVISAET